MNFSRNENKRNSIESKNKVIAYIKYQQGPTFFDDNGTQIQGIEYLSFIIFLDNSKFKSMKNHLNPLKK
jgi:hypothetical protein